MADTFSRVSVILPVYNGARYLAESIRSVLDQDHSDLEVVVVDNASTDASSSVARSIAAEDPRVRVLRLEQKGVSLALNRGIADSDGEYLAFIDADDLWSRFKLERQFQAFSTRGDTEAVFGRVEQFLSPELDDETRKRLHIRDKILPGRVRGTLLIRRECFQRVGAFDESMNYGEFLDWYMRARDAGLQEVMLEDVLLKRRLHGRNMGYTERAGRQDYVRILKRGLDRRRARTGK